jgi:hypothetical protein
MQALSGKCDELATPGGGDDRRIDCTSFASHAES